MTHPEPYMQFSEDYKLVEEAIRYLQENYQRQPELNEIAEAVGLSEFHFQRLFTRWVGISPKRFLQFLTKENAKKLLQRASVMDAAYASGLSSPGRLHDLLVTTEAVTPGEYRARGAGLTIRYGFHPTPFGTALLGITERGICHMSFLQSDQADALEMMRQDWGHAHLTRDDRATEIFLAPIFEKSHNPLHLHLIGTNFQLKVWEALLRIPPGAVTCYEEIASAIGQPRANRAVGTAVGHNHISFIIPCHRVLRKAGDFGNYRWGIYRKQAMLGWEQAQLLKEAV